MNLSIRHLHTLIGFSVKHIAPALKCFWPLMVFSALSFYFERFGPLIIFMILQIAAGAYGTPKWVQFHDGKKKVDFFSFGQRERLYLQKYVTLFLVSVGIISSALITVVLTALLFPQLADIFSVLFTSETASLKFLPLNVLFFVLIAVLSFFTMAYLFFRFGLILPAASLGENITLKESWKISKGFFWKWFGGTIYVQLLTLIVPVFLSVTLYALEMSETYQNFLFSPIAALAITSAYGLFIKDFYKMCRSRTIQK